MSTIRTYDPLNDEDQPAPPELEGKPITPGSEPIDVPRKEAWGLVALIGLGILLTIAWTLWLGYQVVRLALWHFA